MSGKRSRELRQEWIAEVHLPPETPQMIPFHFSSVQKAQAACEEHWTLERLNHAGASDRLHWMLHGEDLWIAALGSVSYKVFRKA
jgi:hypothetical protein